MAKGNAAQGQAGESIPGLNPKHATAGFTESIPGMAAQPTAFTRASRTQRQIDSGKDGIRDLHKEYNELSRMMRVVNRGVKGPMKGKGFLGCADGQLWPDQVDADDERTWLQPGEYMDVPKDVAFLMFGNLWDPTRPDRADIIRKYGNHPFERPGDDKVSGMAPMIPTGCPPIHDLVVYEIDSRGQKVGDFRFVYDIYCRDYGKFYERDITDTSEPANDGEVVIDPRSGDVKEIAVAQ